MTTLMIYVFLLLLLLSLSAYSSSQSTITGGTTTGFSVDLIHRDSPLSPLYDPSATLYSRAADAARRSIIRHESRHRSHVDPDSLSAHLYPNVDGHLLKLSIGTPPADLYGDLDTGSNVVWYRCSPCADCVDQAKAGYFEPQKSSTYKEVACGSPECDILGDRDQHGTPVCRAGGNCPYNSIYMDGSYGKGVVATETLTLGSTDGQPVSFPGFAFGCAHDNKGFNSTYAGVVGLNNEWGSLINQLEPVIRGKFSYCLVPFDDHNTTGVMNFGDTAVIKGAGVVSTPLVRDDYLLILREISVGGNGRRIAVAPSRFPDTIGNIMMDSGTTYSYLYTATFDEVSSEITNVTKLPTIPDPNNLGRVCYRAASVDGFPDITFHFEGHADLTMPPKNNFAMVEDGVVCLAMMPTDIWANVGNMATQNFHVAYDLVARTLSFKPTDCTKLSSQA